MAVVYGAHACVPLLLMPIDQATGYGSELPFSWGDTEMVSCNPALRYDEYRFGIENSGIDSKPSRFVASAFDERKPEFPDRFGPESKKIF